MYQIHFYFSFLYFYNLIIKIYLSCPVNGLKSSNLSYGADIIIYYSFINYIKLPSLSIIGFIL